MMNSKQTPTGRSNGSLSGVQRLMASRRLAARNIIWIANLALVALLGYFVWGIVTHRDEIKPRVTAESPNPGKGSSSKHAGPAETEHSADGARSLFDSAPMTATSGGSDAPATQLQLKLLGTMPGERAVALADIQDTQSKLENLYHIGATIQGATIEEIARGRVVLLVNGRREVLEMVVTSPAGEPPTAESKPATTGSQPTIYPHDIVRSHSPRDFSINRQNLLAKVGSMETVLKAVKLEPYVVNGKTEGMRITGLSDDVAAIASFANIRNGDVLQNVNGQKLTSPQKTFQVLQKARTQPALDLQLLRGDKSVPLHFDMSGSE
jgi:type II secretion system protein C